MTRSLSVSYTLPALSVIFTDNSALYVPVAFTVASLTTGILVILGSVGPVSHPVSYPVDASLTLYCHGNTELNWHLPDMILDG